MMVDECYILLVEDDSSIRESLQELLDMEGYPVMAARHGKEALELLESHPTKPCLILLDLMMPVMDGFDFLKAREASEMYRDVPLCVLSAVVDRSKLPEGLQYIAKPVDVDTLLEVVENSCRG